MMPGLEGCMPGWQVYDCGTTVHPEAVIRGGVVYAVRELTPPNGETFNLYLTVMRIGRTVRFDCLSSEDILQYQPYSQASVRGVIRHLGEIIGRNRKALSSFELECIECMHRLSGAL